MTLYLDKYNGVWEGVFSANPAGEWRLVSGNEHHAGSFHTGEYYNHYETEVFAPLKSIEDGTEYVFATTFKPGKEVWVSDGWLDQYMCDKTQGYDADRIASRGVITDILQVQDEVLVSFTVTVPKSAIVA